MKCIQEVNQISRKTWTQSGLSRSRVGPRYTADAAVAIPIALACIREWIQGSVTVLNRVLTASAADLGFFMYMKGPAAEATDAPQP